MPQPALPVSQSATIDEAKKRKEPCLPMGKIHAMSKKMFDTKIRTI